MPRQTCLLVDGRRLAHLVHAPGEHGRAGLVARQQEGLDLVAQLRLERAVPRGAWAASAQG